MLSPSDITLSGKRALVTGAGRGIGKGIALNLAAFGADVAVTDIDETTARSTAREILAMGRKAVGLKADAGDRSQMDHAFLGAITALGGLEILVNNAGVWGRTPMVRMEEDEWDEHLRVNLKSVYISSRIAGNLWLKEGVPGVIVNIATTEGIRGCPNIAAYSAAKAGMINLTKTLSSELGPYGIRINAVAPDYTPTPGTVVSGYSPAVQERQAKFIPLRRNGTPDDTAGTVIFLCSQLSSWITGQTIIVDGGSLACARVEGPMRVVPLR